MLYDRAKRVVKVTDFGLSRLSDLIPSKRLTPGVVTRYYRAPEVLFESLYSYPVDIWSLGCIFYELCTNKVCFPGDCQIDQIMRIFRVLGTPTFEEIGYQYGINPPMFPKRDDLREIFPNLGLSMEGYDLLGKMLTYNPAKRITAS